MGVRISQPPETSPSRSSPSPPLAAELEGRPTASSAPDSVLALRLQGIFVACERPAAVGSVLTLNLSWSEGAAPIQALARVQALVDADPGTGRESGMRLEFVGVWGERAAEQVKSYLHEATNAEAQRTLFTGAGLRVLVVDDSEAYRQSAAQVMRDSGFEVATANNGLEALSLALKYQPSVILTDVSMPGMDGWQLLRMVRARPTLRRTPVVFFTDLASDAERLRGYQLGVDDYLAKPFTPVELIARIERVLERAQDSEHAAEGGMRGDLAKVALGSLLSFAELERRTGVLQLTREGETATLHLRDGAVVQIELAERYAALSPLLRFFHVLDWESGRFELSDTRVFATDSIRMSTSYAMLEHARRRDEEREAAR